MGISGLLPLLKDITHKAHIKEFRGKRAAVDGYVWLYKGSYSCPEELCEGKPTDKFVKYCMSMVDLLLHHGVQPVVVLDGDKMPAKAITEQQRQSSRAANRERGRQLASAGNKRAAMEMYQRSVEVTPQMARAFMEALTAAGVTFIVAPYEADAQMAYLAKRGLVDIVITEDSDLLVYGCPQVVFKLARTGECDHIKLEDMPLNRNPSFAGFSHENFIEMCILAGCDFVQSLPGMGIKKAHAGVKRFRTFPNVIKFAKLSNTKVPEGYERSVQRAYWTFCHQRVWCPLQRTMVHLNDIPNGNIADSRMFVPSALPEGSDLAFLGAQKPDDLSCAVAEGHIDPMTHEPFIVSIVDGIVYVAPPGSKASHQLEPARLTVPAASRPSLPTKPYTGRHSQPGDMSSLLHTSNGTGGIRSAACGHRGGLPRASAPARIQKASLSHSLRNIGDVAMRRCTSAVKNQATLVCASGGCMSGKQPTVGITKGTLIEAATSMRGRLLAALTTHTRSVGCSAASDCNTPLSTGPSSYPHEKVSQVAGSWACGDESRAVLEASSQPEMSLNCFKEDVDPSNTRIHVAHPPPSSQTESGGDSALSLLTSSSLSQGKGQDLLKVSRFVEASCAKLPASHDSSFKEPIRTECNDVDASPDEDKSVREDPAEVGRSPLVCVQNTLPSGDHGFALPLSGDTVVDICKRPPSPEASLAIVRDQCEIPRSLSRANRQRGSLKELLRRNRSCSSVGRMASHATGLFDPNHEPIEGVPVSSSEAVGNKAVADLKCCKYALSKALPFKKPRRECRL